MAIGPSASRMTSGRIVVIAAFYGILGILAIVLGAGPVLVGAPAPLPAVGASAMAIGAVLSVCAASLLLRRRWSRVAGVVGGLVSASLGAILAIAAAGSMTERCAAADARGTDCQPFELLLVLAGAVIALLGAGSAATVAWTRRSYFRGAPRRRMPR